MQHYLQNKVTHQKPGAAHLSQPRDVARVFKVVQCGARGSLSSDTVLKMTQRLAQVFLFITVVGAERVDPSNVAGSCDKGPLLDKIEALSDNLSEDTKKQTDWKAFIETKRSELGELEKEAQGLGLEDDPDISKKLASLDNTILEYDLKRNNLFSRLDLVPSDMPREKADKRVTAGGAGASWGDSDESYVSEDIAPEQPDTDWKSLIAARRAERDACVRDARELGLHNHPDITKKLEELRIGIQDAVRCDIKSVMEKDLKRAEEQLSIEYSKTLPHEMTSSDCERERKMEELKKREVLACWKRLEAEHTRCLQEVRDFRACGNSIDWGDNEGQSGRDDRHYGSSSIQGQGRPEDYDWRSFIDTKRALADVLEDRWFWCCSETEEILRKMRRDIQNAINTAIKHDAYYLTVKGLEERINHLEVCVKDMETTVKSEVEKTDYKFPKKSEVEELRTFDWLNAYTKANNDLQLRQNNIYREWEKKLDKWKQDYDNLPTSEQHRKLQSQFESIQKELEHVEDMDVTAVVYQLRMIETLSLNATHKFKSDAPPAEKIRKLYEHEKALERLGVTPGGVSRGTGISQIMSWDKITIAIQSKFRKKKTMKFWDRILGTYMFMSCNGTIEERELKRIKSERGAIIEAYPDMKPLVDKQKEQSGLISIKWLMEDFAILKRAIDSGRTIEISDFCPTSKTKSSDIRIQMQNLALSGVLMRKPVSVVMDLKMLATNFEDTIMESSWQKNLIPYYLTLLDILDKDCNEFESKWKDKPGFESSVTKCRNIKTKIKDLSEQLMIKFVRSRLEPMKNIGFSKSDTGGSAASALIDRLLKSESLQIAS